MSNVATVTKFQITSTKLYAPVVTLPIKESIKLTKQLSKGFKRSVFWNEYKSKIETHELDNNNLKRIPLDSSFQGLNRFLFLLLTVLRMMQINLKEIVIKNVFYQE